MRRKLYTSQCSQWNFIISKSVPPIQTSLMILQTYNPFFSYANICCKRSIAIVLNTVSNRLFELTQRLLMTFRGIAKIQFRAFYGGSKAKRRWANPNQGGLDLFKIINDAGSRAFVRQINVFTLLFALCPFSSVRCRWTVSLGVV